MITHNFTFIDLFSGIWGFHLAMHNLWWKCVFASEIDQFARKTYKENFEKISPELFTSNNFNDDIRKINPHDIPDFDILCAWFPCQPFSQAWLKKWFEDMHKNERWNLFFYITEILQEKKPKAFFLENVRWLLSHDNWKTFQIIQNILENELWYSFYYQIIKASDYGLPQNRPRVFMIGFRDEDFLKSFHFPKKIPLKYTMSDIFWGNCEKEIGFTLRVWGRWSNINDRRNWEFYKVDGEIRRIGINEWRKMQGFPEEFIFPVSEVQAMKQLWNSVAINAVQKVAKSMLEYLQTLKPSNKNIMKWKNKWEWSELLVFLKILYEKKIFFWDELERKIQDFIHITKITNQNIKNDFFIADNQITIKDKISWSEKKIVLTKIFSENFLENFSENIQNWKNTFLIPEFNVIENALGIEIIKWWTSNQKSDIELDFQKDLEYKSQGFWIKSYLWATPTLLNASWNTNFIFRVNHLNKDKIDEINSINSPQKLKDRLNAIFNYGGKLEYIWSEKDVMEFNLSMIDTSLSKIIGEILLEFYINRTSNMKEILEKISINKDDNEKQILTNMIKKFLVAIMLWFFAGKKWDWNYQANWAIILQKNGDLLAYHIIRLPDLQNYLLNHIKLDTPSTSRHLFGKLYQEKDGNIYFKLNLQLRFL